jgi:RimJ/RimL family protein N-acetyltransferase
VLFGIFDHGNPSHVGTVRLHDINKLCGHCYNGICIFDKSVWGCGIASDAIRNVTSWAFMTLSLVRIEANAYLENVGSIRTFERAGYRRVSDLYKLLPYELAPLKHAVLVANRSNC